MRVLGLLARWFGSVFVLALAQRAEMRSPYAGDSDATAAMAADERVHAEVVRGLAARGRARVSGTFRAAVFGANDGLVSNLALILGVVGGGAASSTVLLTGLAGLLAGALSMGAGEFISVRSQRELLAASTPDAGADEVLPRLDLDANELALVYRARGVSEIEAKERADAVLREVDAGASATRDEEDQHEVVGTAVGAAVSSFAFFASGAAVPVLPFVFGLNGLAALATAVVLVSLALMLTGATVGVFSGGPPLRRALRQLAIGIGARARGVYRAKTRYRPLTRFFLGGLGCSSVLVDDSAEDLLPPDRGVEGDHGVWLVAGRVLVEALVWPVFVEVAYVLVEDGAGVSLVVDQ
jgi:VIT1/CCC1 family predicted Fe2+/Mn2+ transporter